MEILKQYYETLGITPGVSYEQIKQAYKDSVSVWHPDRFENNPRLKEKAQDKIKEINAAYEKLSIFFREYGSPSFNNSNSQHSQNFSDNAYKEPSRQPKEPVVNKYRYEFKEAIWNPNAAAAWSLLFTPAFGSFLLILNWRALGQRDKAATAKKWFYASLAVSVIFFLMIMGNSYELVYLASLGALIWLVVWYFAFARRQVNYVHEKFYITYNRKPWGSALLGGVAAFFVYLVIFFVIAFAFGEQQSTSAATTPQFYYHFQPFQMPLNMKEACI